MQPTVHGRAWHYASEEEKWRRSCLPCLYLASSRLNALTIACQDLGNLNLTFLTSRADYNPSANAVMIADALSQGRYPLYLSSQAAYRASSTSAAVLGMDTSVAETRNDVFLDSKFKISGSAYRLVCYLMPCNVPSRVPHLRMLTAPLSTGQPRSLPSLHAVAQCRSRGRSKHVHDCSVRSRGQRLSPALRSPVADQIESLGVSSVRWDIAS